jgi:hypothetical protein
MSRCRMTIAIPIRAGLFAAIVLGLVGVFMVGVAAFAQPEDYHRFADQRPMLGVPHMLNVVSNLPFLVVGVWGLAFMMSQRSRRPGVFLEPVERGPYWLVFIGLALTAIGSAYYHADPNNGRLTWDRLPLMVTFMALFTAVIAERLSWKLTGWLLGPLIAAGIGSVLYWHRTETLGAGDLRPYFIAQFLPLLVLPFLLVCFPARYTGTGDLVACLACYVLAKLLELYDGRVYTQTTVVSGHTLKHLVAGLGAWFLLHMIQRRRPVAVGIKNVGQVADVPVGRG